MRYLATPWLIGCIDPMPETIFEFNTIFQSWGCKQRFEQKLDESRRRLVGGWLRMAEGFPLALKSCQGDWSAGHPELCKAQIPGTGPILWRTPCQYMQSTSLFYATLCPKEFWSRTSKLNKTFPFNVFFSLNSQLQPTSSPCTGPRSHTPKVKGDKPASKSQQPKAAPKKGPARRVRGKATQ